MRRIIFLFWYLLTFFFSFCQKDYKYQQTFTTKTGKFSITKPFENIYKIVYVPNGYNRNENISDAVIKTNSLKRCPAKVTDDSVFIDDKLIVVGVHSNEIYRGFYFSLQNDEMIFGAGERALPLNRRGYRLNLYNNPWYGYGEGADNLNYSVPFITSSKGYGLFFDNPSKSYLDIGKTNGNILEYGALSGELNVYVIFGDYQQVLKSYYKLTGTQPLPPRWAFGNFMSRFGYTSETQVKEILSKMKEQNIPVDAIIFDLFWFGDSIKHTLGNLGWMNKQAWPDPKKMITDFKNDGIKTILVTEPYFVETSKNYQASKPYLAVDSTGKPYYLADFYFGKGGLIDIFRKDAQQWFWQFYKKQMDIGVEGWWGDLGEPEKHPADLYHNLKDDGYKRLFKADEVHNIYGHTWTKMLYEHYAQEFPNKRLFSLNRSGFAGSQRYSIFPWTGDVSRSWSGFRAQLQILLGMSMSGVPYVHSDAGGFAGGEGDNELYVRWLQFAAFTPIFRPHGTALYEKDPNAFSFPSEPALIDEHYRGYAKASIRTRYQMLPYNYSLAYGHTKYGKPLMAPLYYYFPDDTTATRVEDEYMWGENILVAPVFEKGATERKYYLPQGEWLNPKTFSLIEGNKWHTDKINIWDFPVYYKEGGFITMIDFPENDQQKQMSNSLKIDDSHLLITYIESKNKSSFEFYDDDGQSKESIEKKQFELINFSSAGKKGNTLELKISSNNGSFSGKPLSRELKYLVVSQSKNKISKILINGKTLDEVPTASELRKNTYISTSTGLIMFDIIFTGNPTDIQIIW